MRVDLFDFDLPDDRIALRPANPRDSARMLVVQSDGSHAGFHVHDLPTFLDPGDVCVVNDTRVIPARLFGRRLSRGEGDGARIEITLHKRLGPHLYRAFAKPAKRLKKGDALILGRDIEATVIDRGEGGDAEIEFLLSGERLDAAIATQGEVPLPPYIASKRAIDAQDRSDYQTVFAREGNSVAAPTAGLHFTPTLIRALTEKRIALQTVNLEVGAGTFLPVSVADTSLHRMHSERARISPETAAVLNAARADGRRILAVGTTALRTLETAVDSTGRFHAFDGETDIFITPGSELKGADVLLTNFHLPRSTLFMLVCAFIGIETMKDVYATAIRDRYRFYSYGDACLLFRRRA